MLADSLRARVALTFPVKSGISLSGSNADLGGQCWDICEYGEIRAIMLPIVLSCFQVPSEQFIHFSHIRRLCFPDDIELTVNLKMKRANQVHSLAVTSFAAYEIGY